MWLDIEDELNRFESDVRDKLFQEFMRKAPQTLIDNDWSYVYELIERLSNKDKRDFARFILHLVEHLGENGFIKVQFEQWGDVEGHVEDNYGDRKTTCDAQFYLDFDKLAVDPKGQGMASVVFSIG